ncbi:MAG: proprotein convertase P-domain-containing protein [Phycisphaeraceae bacterium]|nr:proprotein convertase P-domain-containing protein [Phycisphaeraceae bacterium]
MIAKMIGGIAASAMCAMALGATTPPRQAEFAPDVSADVLAKLRQQELEANLPAPQAPSGPQMRGPCLYSVTRTPALAIVDNTTVSDTMTTGGDPISNLRVQLNILHTWQGDVSVRLRHDASGTEITLIDRPGSPQSSALGFSNDNFGNNTTNVPFVLTDSAATTYDFPQVAAPGITNVTGDWLPDDPFAQQLSIFNGLTATTTWTLFVQDSAGGDTGTVVRWTLCTDSLLGQAVPTGTGSASPSSVPSGQNTTISVQASPAVNPTSTGIMVVADLSQIGGSASQSLSDMGGNLFQHTQLVTAPNGTYVIPFTVSDAQARSSNGTLNVTVIPPGDVCTAALNLPIGGSIIANNTGATNETGLPTCNGLVTWNLGLWFTAVGNGNRWNVTTCSPNTVLNTRLYVFRGSCAGLTCVDAQTATLPACSPSSAASARMCSELGVTYYFLVTNDTSGTGQFEIALIDEGACVSNDLCQNAAPLSVPSVTVVNTTNSTIDLGPPTCTTTIVRGGVWYTVIGNGNRYVADTCDSSSGNFDTRLSVFCPGQAGGGCGNLAGMVCITGIDNATLAPPNGCGTGSQQSRVDWCTQAGATYYILVHGGTGTQGAFGTTTLTLGDLGSCSGAIGCLPLGGCCIGGVCSLQTQPGCAALNGSYFGDNTNCGDGVGPTYEYTSNNPLAIPDNTCTTTGFVSDSQVVSDSFVVGDANVRVQLTHTFIGDLRIHLTNGTVTVAVWERQCAGNDNMDVTFDDEGVTVVCATPTVGTYRPAGVGAGPLSLFDGQPSAGTWTLRVCDGAGADVGTVSSWTLILREQDGSLCGAPTCPADWDGNNTVEVNDIFAFLGDWFAGTPAATNFGGTPGVPAIFAYLTAWFAHGIGPC